MWGFGEGGGGGGVKGITSGKIPGKVQRFKNANQDDCSTRYKLINSIF